MILISSAAVGVAYLGMSEAQTLLVACAFSIVGGAGNGVQWVTAVSAVQELTPQTMQARVMSVLESSAAAMPGVGFILGGLIASVFDPRATFVVAGLGIPAIVALVMPGLRRSWAREDTALGPAALDADDTIMVELIPVGERPSARPDSEVVT